MIGNVGRLNERKGTATALSQHNVYQHTLLTVAFNVGVFKRCNSTIVTQAAEIVDIEKSVKNI